jgi:hypothetical protein
MAQLRAKQIKLAAADDLLIGGTGGNGTVLGKGSVGTVLKVLTGGALGYEKVAALDTTFDKGTTTLTSTDVQSAIRELAGLAGGGVAQVQTELDAVETAVGLNADGTYTQAPATNYLAGANTVKASLVALDTQLKTTQDLAGAAATQTALAAEVTRATDAEGVLRTDLAGEVTRATGIEGALRADLDEEVIRATAEESDIRVDFAAADTAITDAYLAADAAIKSELDATQAGAGLAATGVYTADEAADYIAGATSLFNADQLLDAQIKLNSDAIEALSGGGTGSLANLQTELDATQASVGLATDGALVPFAAGGYAAGEATVKAAIEAIDAQVVVNTASLVTTNGRIDALGAAFNYVGVLTGGATAAAAYDLTSLPADGKDAGDYYKVTTAGYFTLTDAAGAFYVNINDGLIFNTLRGVDIIDNTNANVLAGTNIAVTGSADTGYSVALDGIVPTANGGTGKAALEDVTSTNGAITLGAGAAGSVVNAFALTFNPGAVQFADLAGVGAPGAAADGKYLRWNNTSRAIEYVTPAGLGITIRAEQDFEPTTAANAAVTLAHTPSGDVAVFINGVKLKKTGFTVNAATVTLADTINGYGVETGDTVSVSYSYAA